MLTAPLDGLGKALPKTKLSVFSRKPTLVEVKKNPLLKYLLDV
jgi:hypothetical protein